MSIKEIFATNANGEAIKGFEQKQLRHAE